MSYTKQTWQNLPNQTTPLSAQRLNHMEDGIYDANQVVTQYANGLMSYTDKGKLDGIFNGTSIDSFGDVESEFSAIKDGTDIDSFGDVETALDDVMDDVYEANAVTGSHNILPIKIAEMKTINSSGTWSNDEYTYRGVTYTFTTDEGGYVTSISTSGTSAGGTSLINLKLYTFKAGKKYILNGCYSLAASDVWVGIYDSGTSKFDYVAKNDDNVEVLYEADSQRYVRVRIGTGIDSSNYVFKPMLRLGFDTDPTFQPYAMTNQELTDAVSQVVQSIFAYPSYYTGDMDNLPVGIAYCSSAAVHIPVSTGGFCLTLMRNDNGNEVQIFFVSRDEYAGHIYKRYKKSSNDAWSSWYDYNGTIVT